MNTPLKDIITVPPQRKVKESTHFDLASALFRLLPGLPAACGPFSDFIGRGEVSDLDGVLADLAIDRILKILSLIARGVGVSWLSAVRNNYKLERRTCNS